MARVHGGEVHMTTISINVSDETMPRVKEQAAALGYSDPAAYLLSLLEENLQYVPRDDSKATPQDQKQLESILIERLESKDFVEMQEGDFQRLGEKIAAKLRGGAKP